MCIRHGVLASYTYRLKGPIHTVLFQAAAQESVVLSRQFCSTYTRGRRRERVVLGAVGGREEERRRSGGVVEGGCGGGEVLKLLHAADHNAYVGICSHTIKVFYIYHTRM